MTKDEEKRVENMIHAILGAQHQCALNEKDAKQMNLKKGRLCDFCEDSVKEYMKVILQKEE